MTASEIHAIMTSGFATVSGTVFAAYIAFGAEPAHLITASVKLKFTILHFCYNTCWLLQVMAAPAALFYSKLIYPETEESKTSSSNITYEKS
jgi:pyrimidine nucleoside transport protein